MSLRAGTKSNSAPKSATETLKIFCMSATWLQAGDIARQRNFVGSAGDWQRNLAEGANLARQARHNHFIIDIIASSYIGTESATASPCANFQVPPARSAAAP